MVRAARLVEHGKPLQVEDVQLPEPGEEEVRVEIAFAGVNPVDRYGAEGRVAPDGPLPRTLGAEASGHLDGRPVLVAGGGLGATRDGVWAEAANVPKACVYPLPDGVGLPEASAMGVVGLTAWNVVEMAGVGPDDRVLVLGASGGVGQSVISLAAAAGASVRGQTGSESKAAAIREMGAEDAVVCDAGGLTEAVTGWDPTVVFDPLGGEFTDAALHALKDRGRLVIFGTSAGPEAKVHLQNLYRKGLRVLGYAGLSLSQSELRTGLTHALPALADGRLRIRVDRTLPLEKVNDAFRALTDRDVTGKVLLETGRSSTR